MTATPSYLTGRPPLRRGCRPRFSARSRAAGLEGAIFLRAEFRQPRAYQSLTGPESTNVSRPSADRVILFHVVASGACWVSLGDGERHWSRRGDVIVLPCHPGDGSRLLRHAGDGEQTDVVVLRLVGLLPQQPRRRGRPAQRQGRGAAPGHRLRQDRRLLTRRGAGLRLRLRRGADRPLTACACKWPL